MILEEGLLGCGIDVGGKAANAASGGGISVDSRFFVVPPLFVFVLYDRRIVIVHRNIPHGERPDRTWRSIHLYSLGPEPLGTDEIEDWKRLEYAIHVEEDGPVYESLQRNKLSPVTDDGGLLSPAWESAVQAFYRQWATVLDAD
jgi:choline monooxygenase